MKQAIILDFDGTLANTAHILQKIYNRMAKKKGWPSMTQEDYRRLRKGTLRKALEWAGVHPWELPMLLYKGRKEFLKEITDVELFTGMEELVADLEDAGWDVYVLSQNSQKAVRQILRKNGLDDNVHTLKRASLLGKHLNLRKFLGSHHYKKKDVWMIGDEVRDIIAAKKAGVHIAAVTWGLQDKSVLKQYKPDILADEPSDITKALC